MADPATFLQFTVLFVASYWALLFLVPLKAAHYSADGRLVVRRIFLGNVLAGLLSRRLRRSGTRLLLDVEGQPSIVGGPRASASLVLLLVVPWLRLSEDRREPTAANA
jgi:hypothetical protein